jgi:hypothetical protein
MGSPSKANQSAAITYIPDLVDGACGTIPRSLSPPLSSLRKDASAMLRMATTLLWTAWADFFAWRPKTWWAGVFDAWVHMTLAVVEMYILIATLPLWLAFPGALIAAWLTCCTCVVFTLSWLLNGRKRVMRCAAGSDGWMMGQEAEDEK